jgi:diadenosine tetraphosphatase ApaH/serine/threonine PP2A family protein phosphatase
VIINVGSVGQPRDRDPRSGYSILHEDRIEFVRIAYDIQAVVRKVEAIPDLNDFFGQRLIDGR